MSRQIGTLLLVACVALGGRALCPNGVGSCLQIETSRHDCCARDAALGARDCCCKGSRNTADTQDAAHDRIAQLSHAAHVVGLVHAVAASGAGAAASTPSLPATRHGPPDTLVSHHTALLL